MEATESNLKDFRKEFIAWLEKNKPEKPGFHLPDSFMEVGTDQQFDYLLEWQQTLYNAGYLGMSWPKEYGGRSLPGEFQNIADAEMTKQQVPFMVNTIGLNWAGPVIIHMGTKKHKEMYLEKILSGEEIWCQGFSEPDHGSDLGNAQFKAEKQGNEYLLNGTKIWTSLGTYAKHMILLARTSKEGPNKYAGLSFFLAPVDVPEVEKRPIKKLTGEFGFNETIFTNATVPAENMIGEEGDGWKVAMATLMFERRAAGGQAGGPMITQKSIGDVIRLAQESTRDGKPAIEDPAIREQLIKFMIEDRSLRLNHARAKIPALNTDYPGSIALGSKLYGTEHQRRLAEFAISLQGANANYYLGDPNALEEGMWQRTYFNSFSATIGGGTSQIQKNILSERVLGLAKDNWRADK